MKITFNGGAREVGGSCTLLETEDARVALDYGIKVEEGLRNEIQQHLDAVVITHAHLDHSGNLLSIANKNPIIVGSMATHDITMKLLHDLIKIHKLQGKQLPYSQYDISKVSDLWVTRNHLALPGMEISLHAAGHVLGANMVQVKAQGKNVLYTGDFCIHDTEILDGVDPEVLPKEPDALIMESTYGGTIRPKRPDLEETLLRKIQEAMERGGNILIPAFAFHRLQEITRKIEVAMKDKSLPRYNAYYISGLAYQINNYYNEYKDLLNTKVNNELNPFRFSRVKRLWRTEQIKEPAIVICTSGFGHAGASHALLNKWAGNANNTILIITGFLPPESPLVMAKEGKIIHNGESLQVNATIEQIALSGHADQKELTEFVKKMKPNRTFLVHGSLEQAEALSKKIKRFTQVQIPYKNQQFII
jgi:Cft2 family RNA processing exonuclease